MTFAPDTYGIRTLEFVERMRTCQTYEEMRIIVFAELKWFGFDFVTLWSLPRPGQEFEDAIVFNSRPSDYIEHYERLNYVERDPVVTELRRALAPFSWSDVRAGRRLSKAEIRIIDEALGFGADDGLMIPIISASGDISIFSPCGLKPDLSPRARSALEIIGIYTQQATQRLLRKQDQPRCPHPLTPREREILKWVATGKSDDEIGEILSISHATVTTHVENIKRKMNATRRTYAVVQAIRYGELAL